MAPLGLRPRRQRCRKFLIHRPLSTLESGLDCPADAKQAQQHAERSDRRRPGPAQPRTVSRRARTHRLLEAVIEHGSISKAAKAAGFSYKTAWEAVAAVNNLLPTPAFVTKVGGGAGGAEVTEAGRRLIAVFHKLEDRLTRISNLIAEEGLSGDDKFLPWALGAGFRRETSCGRR